MKRLLLVLALTGCATGIPSPEDAYSALDSRFLGQPLEAALARYGEPNVHYPPRGDRMMFEWHLSTTGRFSEPVTSTTKGTIGGQYPWQSAVPYRQTTTTTRTYTEELSCRLQFVVEIESGRIVATGLVGEMGACQHFMP